MDVVPLFESIVVENPLLLIYIACVLWREECRLIATAYVVCGLCVSHGSGFVVASFVRLLLFLFFVYYSCFFSINTCLTYSCR
jgi:hypothetical protein